MVSSERGKKPEPRLYKYSAVLEWDETPADITVYDNVAWMPEEPSVPVNKHFP